MGTAAILLMVVGCSGGLEDCREIAVPAPHYISSRQCEQDMHDVIDGNAARFDHVFGACTYFDPDLLQSDIEIVWDVSILKGLEVDLEPVIDEEIVLAGQDGSSTLAYRN